MKHVWRTNLIIDSILLALAVPVFFLDRAFTGGSGGWITLNFRGLLFWSYLALVGIYVVVSALSIRLAPWLHGVVRYLATLFLSALILIVGFYAWVRLDDWKQTRRRRAIEAKRAPLASLIELKEWWYYPDEISPTDIRVNVVVHSAGRFDGSVRGSKVRADGQKEVVFTSESDPTNQRRVRQEESFQHQFILKVLQPGSADSLRIDFWLFEPAAAPNERDIAKSYISSPRERDEGNNFFVPLPAPVRR